MGFVASVTKIVDAVPVAVIRSLDSIMEEKDVTEN